MNKKKLLGIHHLTIKQKMIALIGGQLLLFIIVIYALFSWFQDVLESKISALAQQTLKTVTVNVEIQMEQMMELSNAIVSDSSLIRMLRDHPDFGKSSSVWAQVQLLQMLKSFTTGSSYLYGVSIMNPESGKILSTVEGSFPASEEARKQAELWSANSSPMVVHVDLDKEKPLLSRNRTLITLLRKIPGREREDYLMIHTGKQVLQQTIGGLKLWEGTGIMMTDRSGRPVFTTEGGLLAPSVVPDVRFADTNRNGYKLLEIEEESFIAVQQHSPLTDWNITMLIPQKEIMHDVVRMKQSTVLIITGIGLIFVLLSVLLYTQIFNPIKRLMRGMIMVEKGLPHRPLVIKRLDELGFLQKRFNDMVQNEQQMRQQIMEEQLHKKEIELKFLQSQVNPHFLYNTLDSIYWVAVENQAEEIGDVVLDLSRYFRLSLSRGKEFVTIKETIEHLEYYLRIQQFRHTGKFEVRWDVNPEMKPYKILKLMLQPIVENAIVHGMERTAENGLLHIEVGQRGDWVRFCVEDTGIGMKRSSLRNLLREIKSEEGPSEATYGLRNLYQRLKLMYGEDMFFGIGSLSERGTRVTISIRKSRLEGGGLDESYHRRR